MDDYRIKGRLFNSHAYRRKLKSGTNVRTVSLFVLSSDHNVLRLGILFVQDIIMNCINQSKI